MTATSISQWPTRSPSTISVLRGRGDGTFIAAVHYPTGPAPKGVAIATSTATALPICSRRTTAGNYPTCCNPGGDTISLLLNAGGGSFAAAQTYTAGTTPFAIATGDLDGDGDLDVATANWHSNDVTVLRNDGAGRSAAAAVEHRRRRHHQHQRNDHLADQRACRHAGRVRTGSAIRLQLTAADCPNDAHIRSPCPVWRQARCITTA